jgi:cytochrome c556
MLKKTLLAGLALTIVAGTAWALDDKQAVLSGMVREQIPYDAEQFQLRADRLAFMSTMLVDAFRPDTTDFPVETEALDGIWDDFGEFEKLGNAMQEKAMALNEVAQTGDFEAVKGAFVELGQSCKNCHDKFREDND